ncbi:beta-N-acetylhexosaminidase [Oerskovia sp. NPDC060287]|uniref:beta-N-acetylhexosaminidase n=1 Tax=Oerskovia sp. NPDC060287 TaxID=3347095 RepID=UPI003648820F
MSAPTLSPGLLPAPVSLQPATGTFPLTDGTPVRTDPALAAAARWWRRTTEAAFGVDLPFLVAPGASAGPATPASDGPAPATGTPDDAARPGVTLALDATRPAGGYRLEITPQAVLLTAADVAGAHAGVQTLRQLAGPQAYRTAPVDAAPGDPASAVRLPALTIEDRPRFGWRGVLLDVARHFLPQREVMRFVDLAAAHKLNVVQLHLTDDQGWRMQVHRYPLLTEVGGWRTESNVGTWRTGVFDGRPHGGFYTQDDLREIVAYARERGVVVVPEIDAPGHVEAAVAAYPFLGTRKTPHTVRTTWGVSTEVLDPSDEALEFFTNVLDEVCDVFDSPWIAIGGDEVPTTLWRENPAIVALAERRGLADVADLAGWFLARLSEHVTARGRRAVVWDEGFGEQLPRDVVVTAWRGFTVGAHALEAGNDVVMAPEQVVYLDHRAGDGEEEPVPVGFLRTVEDVYAFDPFPAEVLAQHPGLDAAPGRLLGAQAEVWSEHLDSPRRMDYAAFPRLAAFAEVVWSPTAERTPGAPASAEFLARLEHDHLPRLDAAGVEYRPLDGPKPWQQRPGVHGFLRHLDQEMAAGGWAGVGGWVEGRDASSEGQA